MRAVWRDGGASTLGRVARKVRSMLAELWANRRSSSERLILSRKRGESGLSESKAKEILSFVNQDFISVKRKT